MEYKNEYFNLKGDQHFDTQ